MKHKINDKYRLFTLVGALIWLLSRVLRNTFLMDYELKKIFYIEHQILEQLGSVLGY